MIIIVGIYIDDNEKNFTEMILQGTKRYETRNRNTLKSLMKDKDVFLISLKKNKRTVVGKCKVSAERFVDTDVLKQMDEFLGIAETKYFTGKGKYLYHLYDISPVIPFELPKNVSMHGRAWCEW